MYGPGAIGGVINVFTDKDINSITSNTLIFLMAQKELSKSSLILIIKMKIATWTLRFTDFITDGIDANRRWRLGSK